VKRGLHGALFTETNIRIGCADKEFKMQATFPVVSSVESWKPLVASVLREIAVTMVRTPDIDKAIQDLDGFPGWDHWGFIQTPSGEYPKGRRDMSFAVSRLRDEGLVVSPKRGSFQLAGQEPEARIQEPEARIQEPEARIQEPEVRIQEPEVRVEKAEVRVQEPEAQDHPILQQDRGLLVRIISGTPCFGAWKPSHKECKGCPIAGSCAKARPVLIEELTREVAKEQQEQQEQQQQEQPQQQPQQGQQQGQSEPWPFETHTVSFPIFCRGCQKTIPADTRFYRQFGPDGGNFHIECRPRTN
jgi:hypothetical protein